MDLSHHTTPGHHASSDNNKSVKEKNAYKCDFLSSKLSTKSSQLGLTLLYSNSRAAAPSGQGSAALDVYFSSLSSCPECPVSSLQSPLPGPAACKLMSLCNIFLHCRPPFKLQKYHSLQFTQLLTLLLKTASSFCAMHNTLKCF